MGHFLRLIAVVVSVVILGVATPAAAGPWQCATFARAYSGIQIHGDAASWWGQARGQYEQGSAPLVGSVLVFKATGQMRVGHVATVTQIVAPREIRVTHANWSPVDGRRGVIESNVTVLDVSEGGDWSRVRVWYSPAGDLGRRSYPVYGFIYSPAAAAPATSVAVAAVDAMPVELAGL